MGVGLFAENVEGIIHQDAGSLLGGDLEIRSSRPLSPKVETVLNSLPTRGITMTHVRELVAMAATVEKDPQAQEKGTSTQLVELKVVEPTYPLYGQVESDPSGHLQNALNLQDDACPHSPCFGALAQESLLISLGVQVGNQIKIGQEVFSITGILQKEPDRVSLGVGFGPRVIIAHEALAATELVKPGSRIRERYLLRLPESQPVNPLLGELRGLLAKEGIRVSSYRDAQPRIRRFLDQLSTYLGLIGLTSLFVGGIGVAATVRGFIAQKIQTIAILKTIGAKTEIIIKAYLLQSLFLAGIGSCIGVGLGMGIQVVLPVLFKNVLPLPVPSDLFVYPIVKGFILGIIASACFTLWPLLTIRHIPPALVFRREVEHSPPNHITLSAYQRIRGQARAFFHDRYRVVTGLTMVIGLTCLAIWQARSLWLGLVFILAFGVALMVLQVAAKLLLRILSMVPTTRHSKPTSWSVPRHVSEKNDSKKAIEGSGGRQLLSHSFVFRQAIGNIQRPGSQVTGMIVSIGIGVMVIVTIGLIKSALLTAIGEHMPTQAPTFFFVDIQPDQKSQFERIIQVETEMDNYQLRPVVRSRLATLNGVSVNPDDHKGKRNGWYFTREYVLTALKSLPKENVIVQGRWWTEKEGTSLPKDSEKLIGVSVEHEAARNLGVDLGSNVGFDIQGTTLTGQVKSLRNVDWGNLAINFFMILSPGALEGAPYTYIGSAKVSPTEEVPLQQAIVSALPNVTTIKIGDILRNIGTLLQQLSWAIQGMALLCIVSGGVVMVAALSTTRFRRLYEVAILKAIGGTRTVIARSFAIEFAVVGALAGVIGVGLASLLSWGILHFFLELPWTLQPDVLSLGLLLTVLLAITVGFLSTFQILGEPPLKVLREE